MSISYKTENGFTTIIIAENFDGEVAYKNGKITIIRAGGGGAGSFNCGPSGAGGDTGNRGLYGAAICGGGGEAYNPWQYKGDQK